MSLTNKIKNMRKNKDYNKGLSDGREERSLEIARRLSRENIPSDIIFRATGIDMEKLI